MTEKNQSNEKEEYSSNNAESNKLKKWLTYLVFLMIILGVGAMPVFWNKLYQRSTIFYGWLFFAVLIGTSILIVLHVEPRSSSSREERDYRVVRYALLLALIFGIGAVVVAILLVASQIFVMRGTRIW